MDLFDVYPLFDIEPSRALGCTIWDKEGKTYLDLYGGHAVISIGHSHPQYIEAISNQVSKLGFYSNAIQNPLQKSLAKKLGEQSGYTKYSLFLCSSGAEANENALKLASFHNGREKLVAFTKGFHGRTSAAVAVTDNPKIQAPINKLHNTEILPFGDIEAVKNTLSQNDVAAVIIEGAQGIGGIYFPNPDFLEELAKICKETGTVLILDEIQSGYGRTGKFFAHQYANIKPDIITLAKGMGNGFPIGGVMISPEFEASYGLLGTTFGGNHLACSAGLAVLDVMEKENLVENAKHVGDYLITKLSKIEAIKEVRGKGLMIALDFETPVAPIRKELLFNHRIFTGVSGAKTVRLLPPLSISKSQADQFIEALEEVLAD